MKRLKSTCLALLAGLGATAFVSAAPPRTDINPAMLYYQAFNVAVDLSESDRNYLFTNDWAGQKVTPQATQLLDRYANQFKLVRQAALSTVPCDWGIDFTPGPATLLPHLSRVKGIVQALRVRAILDLQSGHPEDARDNLLAAFVLGRNCARDGVLISAMVQLAAEGMIYSTVAQNFYEFPPETLKQLADGFGAAPARRTVADCMPAEKTWFHAWMIDKVLELQKENPGNDAKVVSAIRDLVTGLEGDGQEGQPRLKQNSPSIADQLVQAAGGASAGVLKLLRDEAPFYDKASTILALPCGEYEEQMKNFRAEIQNAANPLLDLTFPALEKCRPKEFGTVTQMAMVRAAIEFKLRGEDGLRSVADPCGQGPFASERFSFEGVDRGFALKSPYAGRGFPEVLIFVEKAGPSFAVSGKDAGEASRK
ncbi:MAG TPA: hypothetical protein VGR78_10435 [Verrucomicrobiae bacterium]|nr:hypothetical protein [Verrucomicrobiae bacterium]